MMMTRHQKRESEQQEKQIHLYDVLLERQANWIEHRRKSQSTHDEGSEIEREEG